MVYQGIPASGPDFSSSGTAASSLPFFPGGVGVFFCSIGKTEIFLTAPEGRILPPLATGTPHAADAVAA